MKNITKIALLFVVAIVFTNVQVQAEATKIGANPVDAIALKAWSTVETEKVATQEDKISLIAWTTSPKEQEELLAMGEYTPVAFAADIEEANLVDMIALKAWSTAETEKVATQEDKISLIAWTTSPKEQEELLAMGEYTPVAFAADIEEKNPVDVISYNVWTN